MGDVEGDVKLEDAEFGESGANQSPTPSNGPEVLKAALEVTSTATSSSTIKRRACHTATKEKEARKDKSIKTHHLNSLLMQENAAAKRQRRREEQRANQELMWMIGTSLILTAAVWASKRESQCCVQTQ